MIHLKRSQVGGVVSALLLCAVSTAHAQEGATTNSSTNSTNSPGPVLGPPGLQDFQLEPRERLVTQPTPQPQASPPADAQPRKQARPEQPAEARPTPPRPAETRRAPAAAPPVPATPETETVPPITADSDAGPAPSLETPIAPLPDSQAQTEPVSTAEGESWWLYAIPLVGLLVLGAALLRRRRRVAEQPAPEEPVAAPATPTADRPADAPPRAERAPRPWLELDLKAQRASFTDTEWVVQFELTVANTGTVSARNLKIDVMLFNAGKEQDKEIGAFFRTAGRDSTKLALPTLEAGRTGIIDGEVAMPLAEMRAMKLNNQTLFIPVVGVNALYDWGEEGSSGQTAKSYIVGRELQEPSEKMGAFRLDLGPRVWRTVGQRQHKLARRF